MENEIYKPIENKKSKEVSIVVSFFIFMIFLTIFANSIARWLHYHNNTEMISKEIEKSISMDEVPDPDPSKYYYRKVKRTKIVRAKGFPKVETIIEEKDLGIFSKKE